MCKLLLFFTHSTKIPFNVFRKEMTKNKCVCLCCKIYIFFKKYCKIINFQLRHFDVDFYEKFYEEYLYLLETQVRTN